LAARWKTLGTAPQNSPAASKLDHFQSVNKFSPASRK